MTWDTDKIIGAGLIFSLVIYLVIVGVIAFFKDTVLPLDVAGNIVTGLAGYMGRNLLSKKQKNEEDGSS